MLKRSDGWRRLGRAVRGFVGAALAPFEILVERQYAAPWAPRGRGC